jgi:tRNA(Arg) A34 adenosine deaminase TadA
MRKLTAQQSNAHDIKQMDAVIRFTARTLTTDRPVPFGALIVSTATGKTLLRAVNRVAKENDPSSHAELRAVRLACKKLRSTSLRGYTMYSTCEPCPMCMANLLWAGIDRIVYGATIADASVHMSQIHIPASEVVRRSDMQCAMTGSIQRKEACKLFTHPKLLKIFAARRLALKKTKATHK